MPLFIGLLLALVSPSLGDLLSFCMPKKKVSKEKGTLHHRRWQKAPSS
jgi:hypothetical protein